MLKRVSCAGTRLPNLRKISSRTKLKLELTTNPQSWELEKLRDGRLCKVRLGKHVAAGARRERSFEDAEDLAHVAKKAIYEVDAQVVEKEGTGVMLQALKPVMDDEAMITFCLFCRNARCSSGSCTHGLSSGTHTDNPILIAEAAATTATTATTVLR